MVFDIVWAVAHMVYQRGRSLKSKTYSTQSFRFLLAALAGETAIFFFHFVVQFRKLTREDNSASVLYMPIFSLTFPPHPANSTVYIWCLTSHAHPTHSGAVPNLTSWYKKVCIESKAGEGMSVSVVFCVPTPRAYRGHICCSGGQIGNHSILDPKCKNCFLAPKLETVWGYGTVS